MNVEAGTTYTILNEAGYKVEVGSVPVPGKGGTPDRLHLETVEEGFVYAEEEWVDIGRTRSRRLYVETIEAMLRHEDIRRVTPQNECDTATPEMFEPEKEGSGEAGSEVTEAGADEVAADTTEDADEDESPSFFTGETTERSGDALVPDIDPEPAEEGEPVFSATDAEEVTAEESESDYQREYATSSDAEFIDADASEAQQDEEAAAEDDTVDETADSEREEEEDDAEFLVGS